MERSSGQNRSTMYTVPSPNGASAAPPPSPARATVASAQQPKQRNRLMADGTRILEQYWSRRPDATQLPPLDDRKQLTRVIKSLPGCEYWSDQKTADWFKRRMRKVQLQLSVPQLVSPSKEALQHLAVLLKGQPSPSPDVIKTWAALLAGNGGPTAVQFWIQYISHVMRATSQRPPSPPPPPPPTTPSPHPPSPVWSLAYSSTPEPIQLPYQHPHPHPHQHPHPHPHQHPHPHPLFRPPSSDSSTARFKPDPSNSPTVASLSIRSLPPESSSSSSSSSSASSASPQTPVAPGPNSWRAFSAAHPYRRRSLLDIVEDVAQAASSTQSVFDCGPLPNSADELVDMFGPYEGKLIKLQHLLDSQQ